jgi:hypothetical protein
VKATDGPFTLRPDPDGPTEILNASGEVIGQVEPRYAELFAEAKNMLALLREYAAPMTLSQMDDHISRRAALLERLKEVDL